MSNRKISDTTKALIEAKGLIEDPENWCQGALEWKGRHCALGALGKVEAGSAQLDCFDHLDNAAQKFGPEMSIVRVNNELGHLAVMRMYRRAIALSMQADAEQEQNQ